MTTIPTNAVHPASRAEWRAWLEQHHTRTEGVWLISFKQATGKPRVTYACGEANRSFLQQRFAGSSR